MEIYKENNANNIDALSPDSSKELKLRSDDKLSNENNATNSIICSGTMDDCVLIKSESTNSKSTDETRNSEDNFLNISIAKENAKNHFGFGSSSNAEFLSNNHESSSYLPGTSIHSDSSDLTFTSEENLKQSNNLNTMVDNENKYSNGNNMAISIPGCMETTPLIEIVPKLPKTEGNEQSENKNENFFGLYQESDQVLQQQKPPLQQGSFLPNENKIGNSQQSDGCSVISNNNALPQTEEVLSSSYSLSQLKSYGSNESLNEEISVALQQYRESSKGNAESIDSESDSSSSSRSSSVLTINSSSDSDSDEHNEKGDDNFDCLKKLKPIKAKGELDLEDLPPIEDLKITVSEEECTPIGKVFQIVDQLVVVQSFKEIPAYDLDTVLFLQGGQPLGKVFDVFGPVVEPYYSIRFNSRDHIEERNITLDQIVYSAPKTKHTNYVFVAQLMKLKGSDASWENDIEPPEIYLDYSDDEQEQRAKKKTRKNKKEMARTDVDPEEPARKRHTAFERQMNERNVRLTAARNHSYSNKSGIPSSKNIFWRPSLPNNSSTCAGPPKIPNVQHQTFGGPPAFNVRAPLPNSPCFIPTRFSNVPDVPRFKNRPPDYTLPFSPIHDPNTSSQFPSRSCGMLPNSTDNSGYQPFPPFSTHSFKTNRLSDNQEPRIFGSSGMMQQFSSWNGMHHSPDPPRMSPQFSSPPPRFQIINSMNQDEMHHSRMPQRIPPPFSSSPLPLRPQVVNSINQNGMQHSPVPLRMPSQFCSPPSHQIVNSMNQNGRPFPWIQSPPHNQSNYNFHRPISPQTNRPHPPPPPPCHQSRPFWPR